MKKEPWGWHLLLDCRAGNLYSVANKVHIVNFVEDLVVKIDMVPYGPCWIERFATHDPSKAGISFCQMIETSNITGHFVERNGDFYLDIFSCKPYNMGLVVDLVNDYFAPSYIHKKFINRDAAA